MVSREGGTIRQLADNDKTPPTYFFTLKMGRYEGSAEQVWAMNCLSVVSALWISRLWCIVGRGLSASD